MSNLKLFFPILCLFLANSCSEPNIIGLEVQPLSDVIIINSLDFNSFTSNTEFVDSVKSDEPLNLVLGEINDPVFNTNKGSFFTQILLNENNIELGENPQVDSVILSFTYSGYYGDLDDFQSMEIFELQDELFFDSIYYSNSFLPTASGLDFFESFSLSNDSTNPTLRIRLTDDFGQQIISLGESSLQNNENFLQEFKGLSISASALNTILYLNPSGSSSFLKIYYHNNNSGQDTLSIDFGLGGDAARLNLFNEKSDENLLSDSLNLYVQSMAGYKSKISILNKDSLRSMLANKAINKALIRFDVEPGSQDLYSAHDKLFLVRLDQDGNQLFLKDFISEGEAHFGGFLNENFYEFNISRFLHEFLDNDLYTNDLYLLPAGGAVNANRTIFKKNISLVIHYSQL